MVTKLGNSAASEEEIFGAHMIQLSLTTRPTPAHEASAMPRQDRAESNEVFVLDTETEDLVSEQRVPQHATPISKNENGESLEQAMTDVGLSQPHPEPIDGAAEPAPQHWTRSTVFGASGDRSAQSGTPFVDEKTGSNAPPQNAVSAFSDAAPSVGMGSQDTDISGPSSNNTQALTLGKGEDIPQGPAVGAAGKTETFGAANGLEGQGDPVIVTPPKGTRVEAAQPTSRDSQMPPTDQPAINADARTPSIGAALQPVPGSHDSTLATQGAVTLESAARNLTHRGTATATNAGEGAENRTEHASASVLPTGSKQAIPKEQAVPLQKGEAPNALSKSTRHLESRAPDETSTQPQSQTDLHVVRTAKGPSGPAQMAGNGPGLSSAVAQVSEMRLTDISTSADIILGASSLEADVKTQSGAPLQSPLQPRPALPQTVLNQLAAVVSNTPNRPVEVLLNPEELGRVRMVMSANDTQIVVSIQAEKPETSDLMRRHLDQLSAEFQELGYTDISFAFSGDDKEPADQPETHSNDADFVTEQDVAPISTHLTVQTSGLDLRL